MPDDGGNGSMSTERQAPQQHRGDPPERDGLPKWLTIVVVLVLLALLSYNILVVGPESLPTSYMLGGLLGAYAGVDQLLKRRDDGDRR